MDIPFTKTNISPILTCPNNGDVGDIYDICGIIKSISIPNGIMLADEVVVVPLLLLPDEEDGLMIICIGCSSVLSLLLDDDGVLEADCDRCNKFEEACGETEVGMGLVVVVGIMGVDVDRFGADGFFLIGDRCCCFVASSFTTPFLLVQFLENVLLAGAAFRSLTKDEFNDDEVRPLCCRFTISSGGEVSLSS